MGNYKIYKSDIAFKKAPEELASIFSRAISAPPERLPLRPDFPRTILRKDVSKILETLAQELEKHGLGGEEPITVNIAYPQKHPELFPSHDNPALHDARTIKSMMDRYSPKNIKWRLADEICETVRLERKGNQTSVHALMCHQRFDIYRPETKTGPSFPDAQEKQFFIVADHCIEQGTTLASLINYITHNGGTVLAATVGRLICDDEPLLQTEPKNARPLPSLTGEFSDAAEKAKRLPQLAKAFSDSAKKEGFDWSPQYCLEEFNKNLKPYGNSAQALTNGECLRLIETVSGGRFDSISFPSLMNRLKAGPS